MRKRAQGRASRKTLSIVIALIFVTPLVIVANLYFSGGALMRYLASNTTPSTNGAAQKGLVGFEVGAKIESFDRGELTRLTNEQRTAAGLGALMQSDGLNKSAEAKCTDMVANNYWAHISPSGLEPWDFFRDAGYGYERAGENLAYGFISNEGVIEGWMNSPSHKENIVGNYTEIGFGICDAPNYMGSGHQVIVVQHFGIPKTFSSRPAPVSVPQPEPYRAPVCTRTPISYKTTYIDASYMYVDEISEYGGVDGYTETCTASSSGYKPADFTYPPYDKTVYRGTKPRPETAP